MYKVIELGSACPHTGEPRVRILDSALTKTASSEIQDFWDRVEADDASAYLWVIGVSALEYYGCNNNGDAFTEHDLKATHEDFVRDAHVFLHHVNKDPEKSIGKPVFSWYNEPMHRVELILRVDKNAHGAEGVVEKIESGVQLYVSMGCTVAYDVCSICGNKAKTRAEYCDHLRYNMKKILPDGRQVYALNPNPKFFDISVVNRPADPTAFALDKKASEGFASADFACSDTAKTAADLGADADYYREKIAALDKLSDMIKQVAGTVADAKGGNGAPPETKPEAKPEAKPETKPETKPEVKADAAHDLKHDARGSERASGRFADGSAPTKHRVTVTIMRGCNPHGFAPHDVDPQDFSVARMLRRSGFDNLEYPHIPVDMLRILRMSPGGLFRILGDVGAPLSFGDALYMGGRHAFGHEFCEDCIPDVMRALPEAIGRLRAEPDSLEDIARSVLSDYGGELDDATHRGMAVRILKPKLELRITLFGGLAPESDLPKTASAERPSFGEKSWSSLSREDFSSSGRNFDTVKLSDGTKVSRYDLRKARLNAATAPGKILGAAMGVAALCAAATAPSIADRVIGGALLGVPAYGLLFGKSRHARTERAEDGSEIRSDVLNRAWKTSPEHTKTAAVRPLTALGIAAPLAMAADYSFNDWKYADDPQARMIAEQSPTAAVARFTKENPLLAAAAGGTLGAVLGSMLRFGR